MTTIDRTRDPVDLLTAARPVDGDLALEWTTARLDATFSRLTVLADEPTAPSSVTRLAATRRSHRPRRRWAALGAAAAVAALAAVAGPAVLGPEAALPRAQAVERLVLTARNAPAVDIPAGSYLYTVITSQQAPTGADAEHTPRNQQTSQVWTDAAASTWRIDTGVVEGKPYRSRLRFDAPTSDAGTIPSSPRGLRTWPTDGPTLDRWLRDRLTTETAAVEDDMVFENLKDQLGLAYTPPGVRAAAVEVIADLPGTRVTSRAGRTSLRYAWQGTNHGLVETLVFDDSTSRVVEEQSSSGSMTYSSRTTTSRLVDSLPGELRGIAAE